MQIEIFFRKKRMKRKIFLKFKIYLNIFYSNCISKTLASHTLYSYILQEHSCSACLFIYLFIATILHAPAVISHPIHDGEQIATSGRVCTGFILEKDDKQRTGILTGNKSTRISSILHLSARFRSFCRQHQKASTNLSRNACSFDSWHWSSASGSPRTFTTHRVAGE